MNRKRKRKMKPGSTMYNDLLGRSGYVPAVEPVDDYDPEDNDETEINEMDFIEKIKEAVNVGRDTIIQRGGDAEKVYLTNNAPQNLQDKAPNGVAWLTNEQPLSITFEGDHEEYEVQPHWIVKEAVEGLKYKKGDKVRYQSDRTKRIRSATVKSVLPDGRLQLSTGYIAHPNTLEEIINDVSDMYLGKKKLSEIGSGGSGGWYTSSAQRDITAYDPADYGSVEFAYNQLKNTNMEVKNHKRIDLHTVRQFLRDIYQGGSHLVVFKDFVKYLVKKGITVAQRKMNKIADMDKI